MPGAHTHHKHEDAVEDESHGTEGLNGGHHVPLEAQGKDNAQGDSKEQDNAERARHLQKRPASTPGAGRIPNAPPQAADPGVAHLCRVKGNFKQGNSVSGGA